MKAIDPAKYEAAYTDITDPGYFLIELRGPTPQSSGPMVLKIPIFEEVGRKLQVGYEIHSSDLTDQSAQFLIKTVLLDEFFKHRYERKADQIEYTNLQSNATFLVPMTS